MKRRSVILALAVILLLTLTSFAQERADRFEQIFDASQDAGRLTARFLQLITRMDEKSGDSTILTSPDGKVMVIDGGNPSTFEDVDRALKALGITRIDYLVASHPHVDHVGSFAQLIYNYEIGAVYTSELEYTTSHYRNYMEAIENTKTPHIILAEGDSFMFGQHVKVEILHPPAGIEYPANYPQGATQFINNRSLVMKMTFKDSSFLFTGDVYVAAERDIIGRYGDKLKADVLKVPHHGDSTSSSKSFRDAVSPKVAVMMHDAIADLRIFQNYSKAGAQTFVTSVDGTVLVSTAGDGEYTIITQFDRVTDFLN